MDAHDQTKPIPAYYCCYLLRSTVRHASLYIGSTPNPSRRLSQHNGDTKGGAKRTSRDRLRPWEMALVVEGFTSRLGALQFEWAWQHPEQSRHISTDGQDMKAESQASSSKCGRTKTRAGRSRRSLTAHLEDLHSLLRSVYFASWPLRVRFFRADVHRVWRIWNERVNTPLPNEKVLLDGDCVAPMENATAAGTVSGLPVDYTNLEGYLEKSKFLLEDTTDNECTLCKAPILPTREQIVVCSQDECRGAHHLLCLSDAFLKGTPDSDIAVPISGACPICGCVIQWTLMMQELSLRNRGENAVLAILDKKARRDRKARAAEASSRRHIANEAEVMVNERDHQTHQHSENASMDDDNLLSEDWYEGLDHESDTDHRVPGNGIASPPSRLEIVIEDSEWDDAEIIE